MEQFENNKDYYVVDIMHIVKAVWRKIWLVVIAGILAAAIGFSIATFLITPTYSSSIMLYVNNSSFSAGDLGFSISTSQLSAAQSLAKTYTVILKNRTTLQRLIDETGVDYNWGELNQMIESSSVNNTEVMRVTVTCEDPYKAEKIANGIAKVLPQRISEIVEGASMEVVDSAVANPRKVAPSATKYAVYGFILGAILAVLGVSLAAFMDNTIHDEEYITNVYDYPILAKVPNLLDSGAKKYDYYYKRSDYSYKVNYSDKYNVKYAEKYIYSSDQDKEKDKKDKNKK